MKHIKKLSVAEQSDLRDRMAIQLISDTIATGGTMSFNKAFSIADEFVEARRLGKQEVEVDCGCKEQKSYRTPKKVFPNNGSPNRPEVPKSRTIRHNVSKPKTWQLTIIAIIMLVGIVCTIWGAVEFFKWVF